MNDPSLDDSSRIALEALNRRRGRLDERAARRSAQPAGSSKNPAKTELRAEQATLDAQHGVQLALLAEGQK